VFKFSVGGSLESSRIQFTPPTATRRRCKLNIRQHDLKRRAPAVCASRVSCKQLGFPDAVTWSTTPANQRIVLSRRRRVGLGDVACLGNETGLMQCRHSTLHGDDSCTDQVFIQCLCADCNDYSSYYLHNRIVTYCDKYVSK